MFHLENWPIGVFCTFGFCFSRKQVLEFSIWAFSARLIFNNDCIPQFLRIFKHLFYSLSFLKANQYTFQESFKRPGWSFVVDWLLDPFRQTSRKKHSLMNKVATVFWHTLLETTFNSDVKTLQFPGVFRKLLKSLAFFMAQTLRYVRRKLARKRHHLQVQLEFLLPLLSQQLEDLLPRPGQNASAFRCKLTWASFKFKNPQATCHLLLRSTLVQCQPSQILPLNVILDHSGLYINYYIAAPIFTTFCLPTSDWF